MIYSQFQEEEEEEEKEEKEEEEEEEVEEKFSISDCQCWGQHKRSDDEGRENQIPGIESLLVPGSRLEY